MLIQKEISNKDPYWSDMFGSEQKEWIEAWRDSCVTDWLEISLCNKAKERGDGTPPFNVVFDKKQIQWVMDTVNGDNGYANIPKNFIKHCCREFYKGFIENLSKKDLNN